MNRCCAEQIAGEEILTILRADGGFVPVRSLCDSAKFDSRAPFLQCRITDVDRLISEGDRAQSFAQFRDRVELG